MTSPQTQRRYTAFVHTKISRVIGASGIHNGTMSFGKMESDASDKDIALDDAAEGAYYHEEQEGVMQTSSTKAPHLPTLFESLGHSNVILIGGAGSSSHKPGAIGEKAWKAGQHGKKALKLPVCINM